MALPAKKQNFNFFDYISWQDNKRWELIAGEAYNMTPAPSPLHQDVLGKLFIQLANYFENRPCQVFLAPFDVRFPDQDEEDDFIETVLQPDIVIICNEKKIDDKGCRGAPDIVIEILSPFTAQRDKTVKFNVYETHGVKEYWLVEPADQTVMVFRLQGGEYGKPTTYIPKDTLTTPMFEGLEINLKKVFPEPGTK